MHHLRAGVTLAEAGRLDLHEGIVDPGPSEGCKRWPEHLRLLNHATGELVPGRCRATNLCRYCQTLYVVETVEMLTLDAMEYAPTLWAVLTAREHLTRADCRRHLEQLRRATRERWPGIEWFVQVEFQRRGALHLNLLIKGVPVGDLDELRLVLVERWCSRVDAEPVGQWAGVIEDGVGVVRYLSKMLAHGLKAEQAPPIGWRGHRTSQTRGYLVRPASVMRREAHRALMLKRKLWRGVSLEVAVHELERDELVEWSLRSSLQGHDVDRARREAARRPFKFAGALMNQSPAECPPDSGLSGGAERQAGGAALAASPASLGPRGVRAVGHPGSGASGPSNAEVSASGTWSLDAAPDSTSTVAIETRGSPSSSRAI